jgi:GT2 family glycosyltransferase
MEKRGLAVVVPTYQRPKLLAALLGDLARQSRRPDAVVVVDGAPRGIESARSVVAWHAERRDAVVRYVPSNHSNLPYQRWLGRRTAGDRGTLLYLDDDVRLREPHIVETLVRPLESTSDTVAGVTAPILFGNTGGAGRESAIAVTRIRLGVSWRYKPGDLAPNGERIPLTATARPYERVGWLRGGAMAIRASFLSDRRFPKDLLALAERGWGLGEDTILSRHLLERGELLLATRAAVWHPGDDPTRAYSREPWRLGYATAYSRRLVNDHYRGSASPTTADRQLLARSLAGAALLHCVRRPAFGAWLRSGRDRRRAAASAIGSALPRRRLAA